jgi:hypothetical protein
VTLGVKKFNGASWVDVGTPGIAAAPSTYTSLAFGYNNAPVISYFNGGVYARSFGNLVILPLQLTAFNGHIENTDALLTWQTDNEVNTREFIIERSTDGRYYSTAGSVQATNTTGNHQYIFTDRKIDQLGASVIYYRLKQVDIDGQSTYSRVLILPVDKPVSRIRCYPNPVTNEANLTITLDKAEAVQARIIDNMGKIVQVQQWNLGAGSTSLSLNMSELAKGLYYIGIKSRSLNIQVPLLKQ